jgi:mannose-6-phosphate isomerase
MAAEQVIYKLIPYAVPKPWGGGHLEKLNGNTAPEKIGEYVLFSDLPQFPVKIQVGSTPMPLAEFWKQNPGTGAAMPFMIKIISTAEPISVQNHPSDDDVKALGLSGNGKLEAWTILAADPDARMYLGLKAGQSSEVLRHLGELKQPLSVFNEFKPQQGQVVILSPGLVHSTTGKLLFYEIQQVSDYTFRIYDFGRGRELNLEQAIRCVHGQKPDIADFSSDLITPRFRVSYHSVKSGLVALRSRNAAVVTWFGKEVELSCGNEFFRAQWGDSFFIPDAAGRSVVIDQKVGAPTDLPVIDMLFEAHL